MKNPKFTIYKDKQDHFRFNLKAANGQIILQSQGYKNKAGCENGIESVKTNAGSEASFERKESKDGHHYFDLKAKNAQVVGVSQMYKSSSGLENGIKAVMEVAKAAPVEDLSDQE